MVDVALALRGSALWLLLLAAVVLAVAADDAAPGSLRRDAELPRGMEVPWFSRATLGDADFAARDELQVTSVTKTEITVGAGVRKWHSLVVGSVTYLVGLGTSSVTILAYKFVAPDVGIGRTYTEIRKTVAIHGTPIAAAPFKHWNAATKELEAILVLSIEGDVNLRWYHLTPNGLNEIRSWPVQTTVTYMKVFEVGAMMKLVMLSPCTSTLELQPCKASAIIYEFSVGGALDATLSQTLTLPEGEAASVEIGVVGDEVFLALSLPEPGVVKLYRYQWPAVSELDESGDNSIRHGWFEPWKDLHSPSVTHSIFFHVSHKMYLAVGGAQSSVFRFVSPTRMEGCPKALQDIGFISTWLTLPVQTYRDEVVLLAEVEHIIDSVVYREVVALTWASSGVFNWQKPLCHVRGESVLEGITCLVDDSARGLRGAVAVQLEDPSVISVLVPRDSNPSTMFHVLTKLQPVVNPLVAELSLLLQTQEWLQHQIDAQDKIMADTEALLQDTLSGGSNVIRGDWIVEEIEALEPVPVITVPPLMNEDQVVDLTESKVLLDWLKSSTQDLLQALSDAAVPVNGELHLHGHRTLTGGVDVKGEASFDSLSVLNLNGEPVQELLQDIVRTDSLEKIGGTKTLQTLEVGDIDFTVINNVPKEDLIFNIPGPIRVHGNLEVEELLYVDGNVDLPPSGTVGGVDFSEEIFVPGRDFKGIIHFDEVTVEGDLSVNVINEVPMTPNNLRAYASGVSMDGNVLYNELYVGGQLQVDYINGFLWKDIVNRIVWKDASDIIEGSTTINGMLKAVNMEVQELNGLDFPRDFVFKTKSDQHITGTKIIQNQLLVGYVDVTNTVDSVPVGSLVTLTTDQNLHGTLKLQKADINDLKVDWAVNGVTINQMHNKNPLIGEGVVTSNVAFSHLIVEGPIQILRTLNKKNFKEVLQDILVVPPSSSGAVVTGKKILQGNLKVSGVGIKVESGLVNGIKIADIARLDADQKFQGKKIISKAVFDNLTLVGLWDGVSVVDLNADAVRLTGNQVTTTQLTFADPSQLHVSSLVISEQLNQDWKVSEGPLSKDGCDSASAPDKCIIKGSVKADAVRVGGNVVVNGKVCGWNLLDFDKRRWSRTRPQTIHEDFSFRELEIRDHVNVTSLKGILITTIMGSNMPVRSGSKNLDMLLSGGFAVDDLHIIGTIHTIEGVNSLNLTMIAQNAVKLTGSNTFLGSLVFEDILNVGSLDVRGPVNDLYLALLIEDAVLKNENRPITVSGRKTFENGFFVEGEIRTESLNGMNPSSIITRSSATTIAGTLQVQGRVHAQSVNLSGLLNGTPVSYFQNRYRLVSVGHHVLRGNTYFVGDVSIGDLLVIGSMKGVQFDNFIRSVVMKNETATITGIKHFNNAVTFENVIVNGLVNNDRLKHLVSDIVLNSNTEPVIIDGRITFTEDFVTKSGMSLTHNLAALHLNSCHFSEWLDSAIYLDKPMKIHGRKTFSSMSSKSDLKLLRMNTVDLSKVITLYKPVDIPADLTSEGIILRSNAKVDGLVNGRLLKQEYDNTLLITGDQTVMGSKIFINDLSVTNNIIMEGTVGGRNLSNSVTLHGDEIITGPVVFHNMVLSGDLHAGLISNIDVQEWQKNAFLTNSPLTQVVTGSWDVMGQVKFVRSAGGSGLLDGHSVKDLIDSVYQAKEANRRNQDQIKADWRQLCYETDALLGKARAQPFLFQQLESVQAIHFSQGIASMHAFEAMENQYLAVSYANSCHGAIYYWNRVHTAWELVDGTVQNMGNVKKWTHLQKNSLTYLVTSSTQGNGCSYEGGNIWRFESAPALFQLRNVHSVDPWHEADIDKAAGVLNLLGPSGVSRWRLEDGSAVKVWNVSLHDTSNSRFVPRSAGLSITDGKLLMSVSQDRSNTSFTEDFDFPARSKGNVIVMEVADGREVVAVTTETSDMLVIYNDVANGRSLATIRAHGAHSLTVMELTAPTRSGQTLLAFIENERLLRVVQYKGVEGFVDVTKAKLAAKIKEMIAVALPTRMYVNRRHFLLLRSDRQILSLEVQMTGDPLDHVVLDCKLD